MARPNPKPTFQYYPAPTLPGAPAGTNFHPELQFWGWTQWIVEIHPPGGGPPTTGTMWRSPDGTWLPNGVTPETWVGWTAEMELHPNRPMPLKPPGLHDTPGGETQVRPQLRPDPRPRPGNVIYVRPPPRPGYSNFPPAPPHDPGPPGPGFPIEGRPPPGQTWGGQPPGSQFKPTGGGGPLDHLIPGLNRPPGNQTFPVIPSQPITVKPVNPPGVGVNFGPSSRPPPGFKPYAPPGGRPPTWGGTQAGPNYKPPPTPPWWATAILGLAPPLRPIIAGTGAIMTIPEVIGPTYYYAYLPWWAWQNNKPPPPTHPGPAPDPLVATPEEILQYEWNLHLFYINLDNWYHINGIEKPQGAPYRPVEPTINDDGMITTPGPLDKYPGSGAQTLPPAVWQLPGAPPQQQYLPPPPRPVTPPDITRPNQPPAPVQIWQNPADPLLRPTPYSVADEPLPPGVLRRYRNIGQHRPDTLSSMTLQGGEGNS